jgi:hypothetical protein
MSLFKVALIGALAFSAVMKVLGEAALLRLRSGALASLCGRSRCPNTAITLRR